jgi:tetratricopeptide (TPR) repeat protein
MRSTLFLALTLTVSAANGFGQCFSLDEVNAEKPEGQLLQQIGQEADEAKKLALMEKLAAEFPKASEAGWVYEQMQALYVKTNNPDKVIEVGEKIMALAPACVESAHQSLKAAEAKKDPDLIKLWSERTADSAAKVIASPKPADADAAETWARRADWAKQVTTYSEYSLYAAALQTADPAKKIALMEALQQRNPASEYMVKGYGQLFLAYTQSRQNDKAVALAEKVLEKDQSDPDILLVVAFDYLAKSKEPAKAHAYAAKVVEVMGAAPKPEGVADADWQKRKGAVVGLAHYISGALYYGQSNWAQSDKELKEALPQLDNPEIKAEALYYLGFGSYKLEKPQEALNYYRQCAAIKSRFQDLANKNMAGLKREYRGLK